MDFDASGDSCLSLWAAVYQKRVREFPVGARVLEIGCAEADWMTPMMAMRPDLVCTGIDWRASGFFPPAKTLVGNVLALELPEASVDVVIGVSSIEHIGLGHYEDDPLDADGDCQTMDLVGRWLKPAGWVYLDVPFRAEGFLVVGTEHRAYDAAAVKARLVRPPLHEVARWYAGNEPGLWPTPGPAGRWQYVALILEKR